ncbi:MurR/RpiR family transcriptional regulator [Roseovarius sp. MMSF_3281]|uniref:MurR/RpiR family transcriptional regulator n=1 Tax=Roseovarius sp. MMSF_3281 TaxID=3046694 RepID=UPI00273E06E0|nr:MurR/RpiR family transcriptional regulator [Roseovarius sp. MMSF_3281]
MAAAQNQEELQAEIARSYDGLSKRLKIIADFVLKDPSGVALLTSATLANELGVAPSAIVRFAQAFGYSGFSEMQAVFKTQMQHDTRSYRDRIRGLEQRKAGRATEEMVASFVDAGIASLQEMHRTTPVALIEQAAEMMASARMVHLLAQKRTFTAATYLSYNLARLEVPAHLLDGAGGTLDQQLSLVGPEDVVFAISFQPGSAETAQAFDHALSVGARSIAICDVPRAPFVNADVLFRISEASVETFRSLNATISLALILAIRTGTLCSERNANR